MCLVDFVLFYWTPGVPGNPVFPTKNRYVFRIDLLMFFSSLLPPFLITFSMKFLHCLILFSRPFLGCYLSVFSHFPDLLFLGEPWRTRVLLEDSYDLRTFTFFEKNVFS